MAGEAPWDFGEARARCRRASQAQVQAEQHLRAAYVAVAEADRAYRRALAERILELAAEGMAITACRTVARGDARVSALAYDLAVAEGVREAASQAAWRLSADRKDAQRFADWSQRRELYETGHQPLPDTTNEEVVL